MSVIGLSKRGSQLIYVLQSDEDAVEIRLSPPYVGVSRLGTVTLQSLESSIPQFLALPQFFARASGVLYNPGGTFSLGARLQPGKIGVFVDWLYDDVLFEVAGLQLYPTESITGPQGPAGPQGPPGPQGPAGVTPTGDQLVSAVCSLSNPQKEDFVACLGFSGVVPDYLSLVTAASPIDIQEAQQIILESAPEVVLPQTAVEIIEEGESQLIAEALPGGGWKLLLLLPLAGLLALKTIMQEISVFSCGENGQPVTKQISFPVLSIGDNTQKVVWQELFTQISYLLQCCKPCESYDWFLWETHRGGKALFPPNGFKAVRLVSVENPDPEVNKWYGDFTIRKYGNLRWLFAVEEHSSAGGGAVSDTALNFWNTDDQIFIKPPGDIIGFEIAQEYPKEYQIWLLPEPLTASGIKL